MTRGGREETQAMTGDRVFVVALAIATAGIYAPGLARGFCSEDFLILRRLWERPSLAWENFVGPWLDTSLVSFYRPLASLVLQAELTIFGAVAWPYLLVQLLAHVANVVIAWSILRRLLSDAWAARWGAIAFALHPLHPNAVSFIASFATVFAASAALVAVRWHLDGRPRAATAALVAGLLCYEQVAVLPAALLALDAARALGGDRSIRRSAARRSAVAWHAAYWLAALSYLVLRRLALGASVGGYRSFQERLDPAAWLELTRGLGSGLQRLVWPQVAPEPWPWIALGAALGVLIAAVVARRAGGRGRRAWAMLLAGLAWCALLLAPFAFVGIVPGNGRYAYLTSFGVALAVGASRPLLELALGRLVGRRAARFAAVGPGVLLLGWLPILAGHGAACLAAGAEARALVASLRDIPSDATVWLAGRPAFVERRGVETAQVFHWGLADTLAPPFGRGPRVLLLPAGATATPDLGSQTGARALRWNRRSARLDPLLPAAPLPMASKGAAASGPAVEIESIDRGRVHLRARAGARARERRGTVRWALVVATPGAGHRQTLRFDRRGRAEVQLPIDLLRALRELYPDGPQILWIERVDEGTAGRRVATSPGTLLTLPMLSLPTDPAADVSLPEAPEDAR